jgi:hypothetical protein
VAGRIGGDGACFFAHNSSSRRAAGKAPFVVI